MNSSDIIILGGGQSAAYAIREIRNNDKKSSITLITEENYYPYERPPLSKDYLLGKKEKQDIEFFESSFYKENNIEFKFQTQIKSADFNNNQLIDLSDNTYKYKKLLITTGSINRTLEVNNLEIKNKDKFIYLRNINDSEKIIQKAKVSSNIIIIGGGFIGLEIASSLSQLKKNVIIIEKSKQLMSRIVPDQIAKIVEKKHQEEGNKIYLESDITSIHESGEFIDVTINNKTNLKADLIIIGVGSKANDEIFKNTNLQLDNGIVVDEYCQTSIENVFAAGDVANFYHPFYKKNLRLESYKHAQNHGTFAGKNILGIKESYNDIPWMWSDQYDINLQLSGICNDFDNIIKRGTNIQDGIIYFFIKNNLIYGACGIGLSGKIGKNITIAGKLSAKKIIVPDENLSDPSIKLNKFLK